MDGKYQNNPVILPFSSTSIFSAAGTLGKPGIVIMSPVRATRNPAPAETFRFRTVMVKSRGAPSLAASSEKDYWVFAMQIGSLSKPRASSSFICFRAPAVSSTPLAW